MKKSLSIGCGRNKPGEDWIGLDHVDNPEVDVVHDLRTGELPFTDNRFEVVEARHILEHFEHGKLIEILEEVHRVTEDAGLFYVVAPHHLSWNSATLDHKQLFSRKTFNVVCVDHSFPTSYPDLFRVLNVTFDFYESDYVAQLISSGMSREEIAAHVPNAVNEIIFELEVVK